MKRLFIAINVLPGQELLKADADLKARCSKGKIKWVEPKLFHLTLKFLGETADEKIRIISDVLSNVASSTNAFNFDLKGIGIFGSSYRPRIIRVNINNGKQLVNLGTLLKQEFGQAGFLNDRQNFVPHLTLARINHVQDKAYFQKSISRYKDVFFQHVYVAEILLYESILHTGGPEYVVLKKYRLLP